MSRIGRHARCRSRQVLLLRLLRATKLPLKALKVLWREFFRQRWTIKVEDGHVVVTRPNDLKKMKSLHGLTRTLIHNMVVGVSEGYQKTLEVNGVGYKAAKAG